jgi:chemotaxis protein methyltransferase CheR
MTPQLSKHKKSYSDNFHQDVISSEDRLRVAEFVDKKVGIQLPETKKALIETRLRKRQKLLGYASLKGYIDSVLEAGEPESDSELTHFLDALTTNKTDFYREEEHFQFLTNYISQHKLMFQDGFNVWSAGCSSGQEPYTLAIELTELENRLNMRLKPTILATDISISSLNKARKAIYSERCVDMIPIEVKRRHLLRARKPGDDRIMIAPETKKLVSFEEFNLVAGDYSEKRSCFNAIFCRNVMIYFNNREREKLTYKFASSLVKGGLLFIGHSETLLDPSGAFERIVPTVYRKRS